MKKNFFPLILILFLFVQSCKDDLSFSNDVEESPQIKEFSFLVKNNPFLLKDYYGIIYDDKIIIECPGLENFDNLIPTFVGSFNKTLVGEKEQFSGKSSVDFTEPVKYEFLLNNEAKKYLVYIVGENLLPIVEINTKNGVPVISKTDNILADITIRNDIGNEVIKDIIKIRGRGNATWNYTKKPYKIKFSETQSPFGFPSNKDWVLLAEANDYSMLRTAYMKEVSKALNLYYAIDFKYVDLYLNGEYQGIYLFTDKIEKAKNRVDITSDGFLFEKDTYYAQEPLYFTSGILKQHFTFKYPDADDGDILEGDDNYNFISSFMTEVEESIIKLETEPSFTDYLTLIDIESFAKWYLTVEITGNFDPNIFYVMQNKESKLQMYPVWDAEWSLGLYDLNWGWEEIPDLANYKIWEGKYLFKYLMKSPAFTNEVKKQWNNFKINIDNINSNIDNYINIIEYAQIKNRNKWPIAGKKNLLVKFDSWEEEINYVRSFFDNRIFFLDNYFESF